MPELLAGYTLMWRVTRNRVDDAETLARQMEARARRYQLGDCGVFPIGIGSDCWFDLTLDEEVDAVFIVSLFNRLPDHVY